MIGGPIAEHEEPADVAALQRDAAERLESLKSEV
jgi:hypothetical protein